MGNVVKNQFLLWDTYNAIVTKDANTIYHVYDKLRTYRGTTLLSASTPADIFPESLKKWGTTLTGTIASTGYYAFASTPLNQINYSAQFRIIVKGTSNTSYNQTLYLKVVGAGAGAPTITLESKTLDTSYICARYIRGVYPKTLANFATYKSFIEIYFDSSVSKDIEIEMLDSDGVDMLGALTATTYTSTYQSVTTVDSYYDGTYANKTFYGTASWASSAGLLRGDYLTGGEALVLYDIVGVNAANKFVKVTTAGAVVKIGNLIGVTAWGVSVDTSMYTHFFGSRTVNASIAGTRNVGKALYLQGVQDGGNFTSDGIITTELIADKSYIRLGFYYATNTCYFDGKQDCFSLDTDGYIYKTNDLYSWSQKSGRAATADKLTFAKTFAITGAVSGSTSVDLGGGLTIDVTLPDVVTAGTYKSLTVNAKGIVTGGTNPTTLAGYGITDAVGSGDSRLSDARVASDVYAWAKASVKPSYTFSEIGSKPTTLSGYGITDAAPSTHVGATGAAHGNATGSVAGFMSSADYTKLAGIATGANNYTHPASGVAAGTYKSVTVDINGHVTSGTNPTTLAGYGITDAVGSGDSRLSDARIASDVYAWAKASVKPSYTFSEIGSKPTTLAGYGITDALGSGANAVSATKWAAAISFALTGAVTGTVNIDGSGNVSMVTTKNHTHPSSEISDATNLNTANMVVKRDASGNFAAGEITGTKFLLGTNAYIVYNATSKSMDFVFN